ncbi:MAG: SBBP repeat-containing protein [candidate division Zixibacteria bacterium]|nr:SBBP repeat-containing protein [candidate division Zixibacteria bacterium]
MSEFRVGIVGFLFFLTAALISGSNLGARENPDLKTGDSVNKNPGGQIDLPVFFIENNGQWPDKIKFRTNTGGFTAWFTNDGFWMQFLRTETNPDPNLSGNSQAQFEQTLVKITFEGASPGTGPVGVNPSGHKSNFFQGNDVTRWRSGVADYNELIYVDIYPGIDLKYYFNENMLEYDLIVAPGADLSKVRIKYQGAPSLGLNEAGELAVSTGRDLIIEQRPLIYQLTGDKLEPVKGKFVLYPNRSFGFELTDSYDPTRPLIIDPRLNYSTYMGGSNDEWGYDIALGGAGTGIVYITGQTSSGNFPFAGAPFQSTLAGGFDIFIACFNTNQVGSLSLEYTTYLGGSGDDHARGIDVDINGNVYVTGWTMSNDFPTNSVVIPYQSVYAGNGDVFLSKLDYTLGTLLYSTYLGGTDDEIGVNVVADDNENAYLTGWTKSLNFPISTIVAPYQSSHAGGIMDAFVTKINTLAMFVNGLEYSSYLGGSQDDMGSGVDLDQINNVYLTGLTSSSNFPTLTPLQPTRAGASDVFITRMDLLQSGTASLQASTFLGGTSYDDGVDIVTDKSTMGMAYVTGNTYSSNFPTQNPFQPAPGGLYDVFVAKISMLYPLSLIYSTYLGGINDDRVMRIDAGANDYVYVTGNTFSVDFPTCCHFAPWNHNYKAAFVTKLNQAGDDLIYSTILNVYGGNNNETFGTGVVVDDYDDDVFVSGYTLATNFPVKDAYQPVNAGLREAFFVRLDTCCIGQTGNINCSNDEEPDISDITAYITFLYLTHAIPCCPDEADVNSDCQYDISDLTRLIDYLYISHKPLVPCRQ